MKPFPIFASPEYLRLLAEAMEWCDWQFIAACGKDLESKMNTIKILLEMSNPTLLDKLVKEELRIWEATK